MTNPVLALHHLSIKPSVNIDFDIQINQLHLYASQIHALVGESGSGKSVTAHAALKLLPSQAKCSGKIWLGKENLLNASESRMRRVRGQEIGMIFQEPMTSLNPLHTIGHQISEAVLWHHGVSQSEAETLSLEWLERVEIPPVSYTHLTLPTNREV